MATTRTFIGNAVGVAQIQTYKPGPQPANTTIAATINGKTASYTSLTGTNDDLVAGLVAAMRAISAPEFGEIQPTAKLSVPSVPSPNSTYLNMQAANIGVPFTIVITLTTPPTVTVARTVVGKPSVNETQTITIGPNAQSGSSFTFTWGGQTTGAIPTPPAPIAGSVGSAGNVDVGAHKYVVTFVTANGETEPSPSITVTPGVASQISLSSIPLGPGTVNARKLYRTKVGGSTYYLLTTIGDNTTTVYTDNTADANLGVTNPPPTNFAFEGAVQALSSVGANNFKVGGMGAPAVSNSAPTSQAIPAPITYTYSFVGSLGGASQAMATANVSAITILPTITVAETQAGYPIQSAIQQVGWQQIIGTAAPGGNFKLTMPGLSVTTGLIPNNATAATVLAAIQAAAPPAYANSFAVSLASSTNNGYSWNIAYQGLLANQAVPQCQIDLSGMTPAPNDTLTAVQKQTQAGSSSGQDETVKVTINNNPTGGNWYLDVVDPNNGNAVLATSTAIGNNPTAAQVQTALGGASVAAVAGSTGGPFTISLVGELGSRKLNVLWASNLSGGGATSGSPPTSNTTGINPPVQTDGSTLSTYGALATNTYYYVITATTASGETTPSNEKSYAVTGPTGLVILNWNVVSGATGYKVYRGISAGSENILVATITDPTIHNYHDSGGTSGAGSPPGSNTAGISVPTLSFSGFGSSGSLAPATYYYEVTAFNGSGETTASNEVNYTLAAPLSTIEVKWASVSGATGYKLYRGTASSGENKLVATINSSASGLFIFDDNGNLGSASSPPGSNTSGIAAPVQNNTTPSGSGGTLATNTYYYEITATNGTGETTASNEKTAAVTGPTGSVALSWGAVTGATGYKIYRGTSAGAENLLVAVVSGGSTTSYTDTGGVAATVNVAETAIGSASVNETQTITLNGATGGSFELASNGNATSPINYNDAPASMQTILQALLGTGNVTISGSAGGPYTATFAGSLAGSPQPLLTPVAGGLVGSVTTAQSLTTVTASTGPNNWDNASNWSPSGVPVNGDTVIFQNNNTSCLYGLAQSAVTLADMTIDMSYTGKIGLPAWNGKYFEYRQTYLQVGVSGTITIGNGKGAGPNLVKLDTGTVATTIIVNASGNSSDPSLPPIIWKGNRSAGSTTISINKGKMAIAPFTGETATVDTIRQNYISNKASDTYILAGGGATITTWQKNGGDADCYTSITTLTHEEGLFSLFDHLSIASTVGTLSLLGGTFYHNATGLVTTISVGTGATYDRTEDSRPVHLGTTKIYGKSSFLDPHGSAVFDTAYQLIGCGYPDLTKFDVGSSITATRTKVTF